MQTLKSSTKSLPLIASILAVAIAALLAFDPNGQAQASTPVLNVENGHYYEAITVDLGIDWPSAKSAAESMSFLGCPGHLATITSEAENVFILNNFPHAGGIELAAALPGDGSMPK